jgi:hypothetical protein
MTMPSRAFVVVLYFLRLTVNGQYQMWVPVDVIPDVCFDAPAYVLVNITDFNPNQYKPHVISMLRTSKNAVSMSISAVDNAGKVVLPKTPVTLQQLTGGRRLPESEDYSPPPQNEEAQSQRKLLESELLEDEDLEDYDFYEDYEDYEKDDEDVYFNIDAHDDELEEEEDTRKLLSGRGGNEHNGRKLKKGGGGSFKSSSSSSRSRSSTPSKSPPSPPPPKYSPSNPMSYKDARRRANPATARRRGAPTPTGLRRRQTGVGGTRFDNPSNPGAGSYGYTSPTKLNNNFPGGYSQTSYGYSGANAHTGGSSSSKIMMAAAAGGAVGLGAGYVMGGGLNGYSMSRWNPHGWGWRNRNCYHDSWSGSCSDCYRSYSRCEQRIDRNAGRDDLMTTGFIPYGYTPPIQFMIEDIAGADYQKGTICPPTGWTPDPNTSTVTWNPPVMQDIWMTFSSVEELAENLATETNGATSSCLLSSSSMMVLMVLGVRGLRFLQ